MAAPLGGGCRAQGMRRQEAVFSHTLRQTTTHTNIKSGRISYEHRRSGHRVYAAEESKKNVWALDFDGVVCDSCGESAQSAWKVCLFIHPCITM